VGGKICPKIGKEEEGKGKREGGKLLRYFLLYYYIIYIIFVE